MLAAAARRRRAVRHGRARQLTCLSQLACAAADVEVTYETVDDGLRRARSRTSPHIELKAPSWKVDALLEVLDERPGKPVVASPRPRS
jgi:hypothetical protein